MEVVSWFILFFFGCSDDVFFANIFHSKKFILSAVLPILVCLVNYVIGIIFYKSLKEKPIKKFMIKTGVFLSIRFVLILLLSFLLIVFDVVYIKFYFLPFVIYFFIFKFIEVLKINKVGF